MNSDNGYNEPTLENPLPTLQVPSNVTRISRCFKRRCHDGTLQVMTYESGVGTGSNAIDTFTGGAFGLGLSEAREQIHPFRLSLRIWLTYATYSEFAMRIHTCASITWTAMKYS